MMPKSDLGVRVNTQLELAHNRLRLGSRRCRYTAKFLVVNFNRTMSIGSYMHRIGRTDRAEKSGMPMATLCFLRTAVVTRLAIGWGSLAEYRSFMVALDSVWRVSVT
jgi:hypothetical protein